jgi:hypothetical protein
MQRLKQLMASASRLHRYQIDAPAERVVAFYNNAIRWTRLSCRTFAANAVRFQLLGRATAATSPSKWPRFELAAHNQ